MSVCSRDAFTKASEPLVPTCPQEAVLAQYVRWVMEPALPQQPGIKSSLGRTKFARDRLSETTWHDGGSSGRFLHNLPIIRRLHISERNIECRNLRFVGISAILYTLRTRAIFVSAYPQDISTDSDTSISKIPGRRDSSYFSRPLSRILTGTRHCTQPVALSIKVETRPLWRLTKKLTDTHPPTICWVFGLFGGFGALLTRCAESARSEPGGERSGASWRQVRIVNRRAPTSDRRCAIPTIGIRSDLLFTRGGKSRIHGVADRLWLSRRTS